ncbi:MAG: cytochrome c oxidase assembly protein [Sulfobacillus sp.]
MLANWGFSALWNPPIALGLILIGALYAWVVGPLRVRLGNHLPVRLNQQIIFYLALVLLYLAVGSPLDVISDHYLFSAHMLQHMMLAVVVAPLVLIGTPDWFWRPVYRTPVVGKVLAFLTRPLIAVLVFNILFSYMHFPGFYDLSLRNDTVHFIEHATILLTGMFMWWPVFSPLPELPALSDPLKILYLFVDGLLMMVAFATITFAPTPIYTFYLTAPRLIPGVSPLLDQQLGGLVMHYMTLTAYGAATVWAFFHWVRGERMKEEFGLLPRPEPRPGRSNPPSGAPLNGRLP